MQVPHCLFMSICWLSLKGCHGSSSRTLHHICQSRHGTSSKSRTCRELCGEYNFTIAFCYLSDCEVVHWKMEMPIQYSSIGQLWNISDMYLAFRVCCYQAHDCRHLVLTLAYSYVWYTARMDTETGFVSFPNSKDLSLVLFLFYSPPALLLHWFPELLCS